MLFTYQTIADSLVCCDTIEEGSWINLINPTEMEINKVVEATGLDYDFLKYALDDEESPRIEVEDDQTLLIINIPIIEKGDILYETILLPFAWRTPTCSRKSPPGESRILLRLRKPASSSRCFIAKPIFSYAICAIFIAAIRK